MTINTMFMVSTFSTPTGISTVNVADFVSSEVDNTTRTNFTSRDTFADYPMDEIRASIATAEILIPSQLTTVDEIDAWLMDL
ncbi:hypothetical protein [Raoultella planticola]|uniref:hypothetical protein n=1 Tax=Raoultella planticola TaxID=575 RepID=UPI00177E1629|nr:hypothetical protein [Raoultella planticola]MBE0016164.1 hypothetical protein [Raoultella planticola]MDV1187672.1 hypothetical protein [Raoultella planticola]